jgi:hypothetical protein
VVSFLDLFQGNMLDFVRGHHGLTSDVISHFDLLGDLKDKDAEPPVGIIETHRDSSGRHQKKMDCVTMKLVERETGLPLDLVVLINSFLKGQGQMMRNNLIFTTKAKKG